MSAQDEIAAELEMLNGVLAGAPDDIEPLSAEWITMQSLLVRQADLLHELAVAQSRYEFEVALSGEAIVGSSVETGFLGKVLESVQATVWSVAQSLMIGERRGGSFGREVVDAGALRLVASEPGSFKVGFVGPDRSIQRSFEDEEEPLPVFDDAVSRILDVIDTVETDIEGQHLTAALSQLGGHRALGHLKKLTGILASHQTGARVVQRIPFDNLSPREATLSPGGARRMQLILSRTASETETLQLRGRLSGLRWRTPSFDLEIVDAEPLTGSVARELRDELRAAFDMDVVAEIERTVTRSEIAGDQTVTYRLVGIGQIMSPATPTDVDH